MWGNVKFLSPVFNLRNNNPAPSGVLDSSQIIRDKVSNRQGNSLTQV